MPEVHFGKQPDIAPDDLGAQQGPEIEVVGKDIHDDQQSIEDILGLTDARNSAPRRLNHPKTREVLGDDKSSEFDERDKKIQELQNKLEDAYRKEGEYGQKVVGPLRAKVEELERRLGEREQSSQGNGSGQPTNYSAKDMVPMLFGEGADTEDPENIRLASLAKTLLSVSEAGTQNYVNALEQKLDQLTEMVSGTQALASSGMSQDEIRQAEEEFPELKDLPSAKRYSLLSRLREASNRGGGDTTPRDEGGRFVSRGRPNPEDVVEGSTVVRHPGQDDKTQDERFNRFREVAYDRKKGGAKAATNVFLDMIRSGAFND